MSQKVIVKTHQPVRYVLGRPVTPDGIELDLDTLHDSERADLEATQGITITPLAKAKRETDLAAEQAAAAERAAEAVAKAEAAAAKKVKDEAAAADAAAKAEAAAKSATEAAAAKKAAAAAAAATKKAGAKGGAAKAGKEK